MRVHFSSKKLDKTCKTPQSMNKEFGDQMGKKLKMRLNELISQPNLSLISVKPPPRRHMLKGDRKGQFAVDLVHPYRLIFKPAGESNYKKEDGSIDVTLVTEIIILEVVDYHD